MNKEQNILTIDELWGTFEEINYYRDKGMPDEDIQKYNLINVTSLNIDYSIFHPDCNYIKLKEQVYKIPRDIKIAECIRYDKGNPPIKLTGELKTKEEIVNKVLEVFPDADINKLTEIINPEQ